MGTFYKTYQQDFNYSFSSDFSLYIDCVLKMFQKHLSKLKSNENYTFNIILNLKILKYIHLLNYIIANISEHLS